MKKASLICASVIMQNVQNCVCGERVKWIKESSLEPDKTKFAYAVEKLLYTTHVIFLGIFYSGQQRFLWLSGFGFSPGCSSWQKYFPL